MGEDLLRYSNKIESIDLRQCPYDHAKKAYLSGITVRNIYESFTHKMAAKASWHRYGTKLHHCHPVYYESLHAFSRTLISVVNQSSTLSELPVALDSDALLALRRLFPEIDSLVRVTLVPPRRSPRSRAARQTSDDQVALVAPARSSSGNVVLLHQHPLPLQSAPASSRSLVAHEVSDILATRTTICLQCFDAVGWAAERASSL